MGELERRLRAVRRDAPKGEIIRLCACDPLNLTGIITPGARVPAMLGQWVSYRDGVPQVEEQRGPAASRRPEPAGLNAR